MRVVALIPVKSLEHGKSRLSESLDLPHRIQLTEDTLRRLMHVLRTEPRIERIVVVTRDEAVVDWLHGRSVEVVREHGHGLNAALTEARVAIGRCEALLVLPADVAAISSYDVARLIDIADTARKPCIVLSPDRHSRGTNALLLHPPNVIEFAFGSESLRMHTAAATDADAHVYVYRSESLSLDLDLPEDYELYSRQW